MLKLLSIALASYFIMATSIYDFKVPGLEGGTIDISQFKGKKIMIVNTASKCGNTPQYSELEQLYKKYKDKLVIIGFPANNFGGQEPGSREEISEFCKRNYGVTFPMFAKVDVNGENTHPLFKYLKSQAKGVLGSEAIKWNFTKFLVDRNGQVVGRFASNVSPLKLKEEIEKLLVV